MPGRPARPPDRPVPWLPPGAATGAIRGIVYFGGAGAGAGALVLAAYAVVGAVATMLAAGRGQRRDDDAVAPREAAAAVPA